MSEENGGAAFAASGHPGLQFVAQEGMTLRDYFAAKAMMTWAENYDRETAARWAYEMADAMLRARGQ